MPSDLTELEMARRAALVFADNLSKIGKENDIVEIGMLSAMIYTWDTSLKTGTIADLARINKEYMISQQPALELLREIEKRDVELDSNIKQ